MKMTKNSKIHVKKNDQVQILSGNDRGKQGKVLRVYPKESRVVVEGVNIRTYHERPTAKNTTGGISKREHPIHASNVKKI